MKAEIFFYDPDQMLIIKKQHLWFITEINKEMGTASYYVHFPRLLKKKIVQHSMEHAVYIEKHHTFFYIQFNKIFRQTI